MLPSNDSQSTVIVVDFEGIERNSEFMSSGHSRSTADHLTIFITFMLAGVITYRDFFIYQTFLFSVVLTYPILASIWHWMRKSCDSKSGSDSAVSVLSTLKYISHGYLEWDSRDDFFLRCSNAGFITLIIWDILYTLSKAKGMEHNTSWEWSSNEAYYFFELLALLLSSIIAEHEEG